jgi:hypothetical protein
MIKQKIWELYFPSELESSELGKYREEVLRIKEEIMSDEKMLGRFVLAGLFLTYRACNHMGCAVASSEAVNIEGVHGDRLENAESILGFPIEGTQHYLSLIRMGTAKQFNPFVKLSNHLIKYVTKG